MVEHELKIKVNLISTKKKHVKIHLPVTEIDDSLPTPAMSCVDWPEFTLEYFREV